MRSCIAEQRDWINTQFDRERKGGISGLNMNLITCYGCGRIRRDMGCDLRQVDNLVDRTCRNDIPPLLTNNILNHEAADLVRIWSRRWL